MKGLSISSLIFNMVLNLILLPFTFLNLYYFLNGSMIAATWEMLILLPWIIQGFVLFLQIYPIIAITTVGIKRKKFTRFEFWNIFLILTALTQIAFFNVIMYM